jgi:hypothetical protein
MVSRRLDTSRVPEAAVPTYWPPNFTLSTDPKRGSGVDFSVSMYNATSTRYWDVAGEELATRHVQQNPRWIRAQVTFRF